MRHHLPCMGYVSMQRVRTFRYVVYDQVHDYVRNGWVVSATFPPSVHHSQYSLIMEKRMAVTQDSPLYGMACNLNDIEYRLTNEFSCQPHTVGGELIASVIGLREQIDEINNALIDVMPHLSDILQTYHADEQRDYEEEAEATGQKPTNHIVLSIEAMAKFLHWVEDLSDV